MNFVLDTGISKTIITELTGVDSVHLNYTHEVTLAGLGDGEPGTAYASTANEIFIPHPSRGAEGIKDIGHDIYLLSKDHFSLSKQLGIQINGLIGFDFFNAFIIEVNYNRKEITFHRPETFVKTRRFRKYQEIPIEIIGNKSFIEATVIQKENSPVPVKLMIDTGASLAAWLAVFTNQQLSIPEKTIPALLGQGLSGPISGKNGRIMTLKVGDFEFNNPVVSFPDSSSVYGIMEKKLRNGSLGNDILRRFNIVINYHDKVLLLKPNSDYTDPFSYNLSGMEVEKPFVNLPVYTVFEVTKDSPADLAGVKINDQIDIINHLNSSTLTLDGINSILHGYNGKSVRLKVLRNGKAQRFRFKLHTSI